MNVPNFYGRRKRLVFWVWLFTWCDSIGKGIKRNCRLRSSMRVFFQRIPFAETSLIVEMQGVSTPIPSMNIFVWGSQSGKCRYFRLHEKYMRTWPLVVVLNTAMCPPGARYTRLKIGEVGSTGSNRGQQPRPHLKTNNKNPLVQVSS